MGSAVITIRHCVGSSGTSVEMPDRRNPAISEFNEHRTYWNVHEAARATGIGDS